MPGLSNFTVLSYQKVLVCNRILFATSGPRPRVAVALSGDGLALNVPRRLCSFPQE
jgi:hypothetical protein